MLSEFLFGFSLPLRALRLILSRRTLLSLSIVPLLISIFVYWLVYLHVFGEAQAWLEDRSLQLSHAVFGSIGWLAALSRYTVLISTEIIFWLTAGFLLAPLSNLAALPFNDFLAEHAESYSKPILVSVGKQSWGVLARQFLLDLIKNIIAGAALILCFLLSWVPVLNIAAHLVGWLLVAFQYLSYPQTRRDWGVWRSFVYLLRLRTLPGALGLGLVLSFLFAIPIFSVLVSPIAVVSGTLLFARQQEENT